MTFTKKHGFDKNESTKPTPDTAPNYCTQRFGKGNCDSEESCKKYCQEHPDECPGFKGYTRAVEGSTSTETNEKSYVGPSGCRTEAECKNWCNDHPDKCPGFSQAKAQEESGKREYELRKKQMEQNQETQKRQFESGREMMQQNYEYRPSNSGSQGSGIGSPSYPSTSTQPVLLNPPP